LLQKIAIDGQWQIKATAQSQNFVYTVTGRYRPAVAQSARALGLKGRFLSVEMGAGLSFFGFYDFTKLSGGPNICAT
jgi:hypothetical protein